MNKEKLSHGGRRAGAGRPKIKDKKIPVSFSLKRQDIDIFENLSKSDELIEIELENGKIVRCTPNHKIYTKRGVKEARYLLEDDEIISFKTFVCQKCGKESVPTTTSSRHKYCDECAKEKRYIKNIRNKRKHNNTCKECNINFIANTWNKLFCSKECYEKYKNTLIKIKCKKMWFIF